MGRQLRTEEIYEALFDDAVLARLPDLLAEAANARSALLAWQHKDGFSETLAHSHLGDTWLAGYSAFAEIDPYRNLALQPQNLNRVILPNEVVSASAFQRSIIFNELIRKYNDDTVFCVGSGIQSAWGNGILGVHRGRQGQAFDNHDATRLEKVSVHVERVLRARGEMASARRAAAFAQGALDTVGLVAITVRRDGRILHNNAATERVFGRADGLALKSGKLVAVAQDAQNALERAILLATAASSPTATSAIIERGLGEPAYLLTVTPLVGRVGEPAALVLFRDPAVPDHSLAGRLRSLFNLTNAEAAVAIDVANGLAVANIARNRGVRISTLRAQLKSIAAKTGCSRQTELVALMRHLPPIST